MLAIVFSLVIVAASMHEMLSAPSITKRIYGGKLAMSGDFPYQVYLEVKDGITSYGCGGSIIDEFWILTAAHCIAIEK